LRLVPPPRLAPIGEKAKPIWREGYTPPEVLAEASVSAKTGVYLIGALLFELLTGTALPVEGASELLLAGIPLPGVPQVLNQMLASPNLRAAPQEVMAQLKRLTQSPDPTFDIAAFTSVGLNPTRNYNEDAYSYRSERLKTQWNNTLLLRACVSDGMGGMASGELASQAAVETFVSGIAPHPIDDPKAQADWAVRLVWEANTAVIEALAGKDGGCTLSGVIFLGTRYVLGHVGDTRAYLWTPQNLKQLTRDHSLVATMIASGMITAEEAQHHPDRNKVLRSLGNLRQPQDNYVDTLEATMGSPSTALNLGEILLLVSDGVWGEVDDKDIAAMVAASPDNLQKIAEALVQAAIDAGAPDNATALLIKRRA
jgi:protein phosphatase